ncbi:TPA: hypothetical protein U2I61_004272 [Providencia rettgeri]|nr:hypothetical protein [Providencia rettgeri]HEM7189734.1 hypothetical protein [Providencia rettgeri]
MKKLIFIIGIGLLLNGCAKAPKPISWDEIDNISSQPVNSNVESTIESLTNKNVFK